MFYFSANSITQVHLAAKLFVHVGEFESSKSAMNMLAPEFSALITILRSTGYRDFHPSVSKISGNGSNGPVTFANRFRLGKEIRRFAASARCWRATRSASNSRRRASNLRCNSARNAVAGGAKISSVPAGTDCVRDIHCLDIPVI